jgi:hypothetical protein
MTEQQERYLTIGRNDLVYPGRGSAAKADMDTIEGHDLLLDQRRASGEYSEVPKDFGKLQEVILEASMEATGESLARGEAATTLHVIMSEFLDEGEAFQVKEDGPLNEWVRETLVRLHPDVSEFDIDTMVRSLDGFPPVERVGDDYELAS